MIGKPCHSAPHEQNNPPPAANSHMLPNNPQPPDPIAIIPQLQRELRRISRNVASLQEALGRVEARQTAAVALSVAGQNLADYEFRVFSQWGEDGIIQFLIRNLKIPDKSFVEFGVENYREANTRFLLMHDNWRGLIIDGSQGNIDSVRAEDLYWRFQLTAVCSFITPSNINSLIESNGFVGELGLLSVDIDGMDYWVWNNITVVSPAIVIVEYNALFGPDRAVTVPLHEQFTRSAAHYSMLYFGASLAAMVKLGHARGYACVGCNTAGNNAFFVRRDLMPPHWKSLSAREAFVPSKFRESRDETGKLTYASEAALKAILEKLPVVEV